jgi:DNA-binding response OmpR family regulator
MQPRILVVDDEKNLADTLAAILQSKNYQARVAYDGLQGFETALSFHPSLVLSDVVMPRRNGVDMAIMIMETLPETKILLISGQAATVGLLEDARLKGYDFECIAKPIHPVELLEKVESLLSADATQQAV